MIGHKNIFHFLFSYTPRRPHNGFEMMIESRCEMMEMRFDRGLANGAFVPPSPWGGGTEVARPHVLRTNPHAMLTDPTQPSAAQGMPVRGLLCFLALVLPGSAVASTPNGEQFHRWQVSSISSLSGVSGDDASAVLQQNRGCTPEGYDCSELTVRWVKGSYVTVSITVANCNGDKEFGASYKMPVDRWLNQRRKSERLVEASFRTWLDQARAQCRGPNRLGDFDLKSLRPALRNLTLRIAGLSQ